MAGRELPAMPDPALTKDEGVVAADLAQDLEVRNHALPINRHAAVTSPGIRLRAGVTDR